ncbi:MAG: M36 family metallopeptidase [Rubricoccaceae bacterium]
MRLRYGLLALALAFPLLAQAQLSPAVHAAQQHFRATKAADLAPGDLDDLHPSDVYVDRLTGATQVYLVQRHEGIPVLGTTTAATVLPSGDVLSVADRFQKNLARQAAPAVPSLAAAAAEATALAHVARLSREAVREAEREGHYTPLVSDDPATDAARAARVATYERLLEPRLVYVRDGQGALRLAYDLTIAGDGGPQGQELWSVQVDAHSGRVLSAVDEVVREREEHLPREAMRAPRSLAPAAAEGLEATTAPLAAWGAAGVTPVGTYRVVPYPFESPNHGAVALVAGTPDVVASRLGWHATAAQSFTITRGNNVWAYADRTASNTPDSTPDAQPDGGAGLVFDFPFNPSLAPVDNLASAVTNLFYWNNIVHDIAYRYGFDEPSGNFQASNFGLGGLGNDPVRAEAQDGSGTDNANFSSPVDGVSGRMQMFEWSGGTEVRVTAPANIAGPKPSSGAAFGVRGVGVTRPVVLIQGQFGAVGCNESGNTSITNTAAISGNIALIERGNCNFVTKARAAQAAGAAGVMIFNSANPATGTPESLVTMALPDGEPNDVTIPAVFVQRSTGLAISESFLDVTALVRVDQNRDSDMDAGVIVHEYAHGISIRLTGGPSTNCLNGQEQMGEGWSDYYGLMLTMQPGDTGAQRRGIATYLQFESTDGRGIRNAPYSTDFSVNNYTYQDVISFGGTTGQARSLSVPHGVGFVWGSMLWDMTWNLIQTNGFDPDLYNASGMAGNQVALRLVTQALKMQPCAPGFVDGRNAILAADQMLYGGAHAAQIWTAFARRGLGANATQGSSAVLNDGTADFTTPPGVSNETDAVAGASRLEIAGPNPFRTRTAVTLEVDAPQTVLVALYDLLGRRLAVLHDGALAAGVPSTVDVEAAGLPAGTYVVQATGETFRATQRVTIVR